MGYRVLLIAVQGEDVEEIHRRFGVRATEVYQEIPESPVSGVMLPNGAYLLYVNDDITPEDEVFERLTRGTAAVSCFAHEGCMNSLTTGWEDGAEVWSVYHDGSDDVMHLEIDGSPPAELAAIAEQGLELQLAEPEDSDVDFVFDIPIELFVILGGLRYDMDPEDAGPAPWQVLERLSPVPKTDASS